jgi:hypothetical protein
LFSFRNEVDIKGQDGVIYKGRIDVDKLPAVDVHKKKSMVVLAPLPAQRSRLETHSIPSFHQRQRDLSGNDIELNVRSPIVPNLEPALPREESFT